MKRSGKLWLAGCIIAGIGVIFLMIEKDAPYISSYPIIFIAIAVIFAQYAKKAENKERREIADGIPDQKD